MDARVGDIDQHLTAMEAADTSTDEGAHSALAHAMAATKRINDVHEETSRIRERLEGEVSRDVVEKLDEWIKRLVGALTKIATQLKATFSISVGTGISITMNFGPFDEPES
ncbi:MAG: hypothetical protein ACP5O0_10960 [Acidimicrobiales bacterium]